MANAKRDPNAQGTKTRGQPSSAGQGDRAIIPGSEEITPTNPRGEGDSGVGHDRMHAGSTAAGTDTDVMGSEGGGGEATNAGRGQPARKRDVKDLDPGQEAGRH